MKVAFVSSAIQSLGVEYISAVLKKERYQVKLFVDPQLFDDGMFYFKRLKKIFDYKDRIIEEIKAYQPDLVGISVLTDYYEWATEIAMRIKGKINIPIIFGGMHPTLVPERVIKNNFVDMVCVGEGEYPMLELVESIEKGKIDYTIKNIWFKKDGKIIRNEIRPLIKNLDSLPVPDKDIYYSVSPHFKAFYFTVVGRGCPYICSFCCNSYLNILYKGKGKLVRLRSSAHIIQELLYSIRKHGIKFIFFADENFGMNIEWLKNFSREYKRNIAVQYGCIMHPRDVTPEKIKYLKESGCRLISLGIQTWDRNIREQWFDRWVSNETMVKAIELVQEAKIELMVDNIIEVPGQNLKDLIRTNMIYTRLKPNRIQFYRLRYFPKHRITIKAKEEGWISSSLFEDIQEGKDYKRFSVKSLFVGKLRENMDFVKVQNVLFMMDMLPGKILRYIIKKRLYRLFLNIFNPSLLLMLRGLFYLDAEARIARKLVILRYAYFIKNKFFPSGKRYKYHESSICK